ncbi:MAG: Uma2 family endonuclease [Gloeomargarita sp. HHBFW_bins_205]
MVTTSRKLSLAEYLEYDDGTDTRYKLVKGELVPLVLPTGRYVAFCQRLERLLEQEIQGLGTDWLVGRGDGGVCLPRGVGLATVRIPDLVVIPQDTWAQWQEKVAVIDCDLPPPLLVIEVVSPSTRDTDYRTKRPEYAAWDIPEYWIVDPQEETITVLINRDGWFDAQTDSGDRRLQTLTFADAAWTPWPVLAV